MLMNREQAADCLSKPLPTAIELTSATAIPLPSQSIPISSIIVDPLQNSLVHPNISLHSGNEILLQVTI